MSSPANTSLRNAMEELGQALKLSFGDKPECKEAIAQIEETIKSIEKRLAAASTSTNKTTSAAIISQEQNFAPDDLENANVKSPNTVPEVILS